MVEEDLENRRMPLMNLAKPGRFLLIAGEEGAEWCDAAVAAAKECGIALDAVRIGHVDGDYRDPTSTWTRYRQISKQGAILVRPDRFIAWRSIGTSSSPKSELTAALSKVLAHDSAA